MIRITARGQLVADPVARTDRRGQTFSTFRVASTQRKRGADGVWRDVDTTFFSVIAFNALGGNVATSLRKGQPIIVEGTATLRGYVDRQGHSRDSMEVVADRVGHDLTFGRSSYLKINKAAAQGHDPVYDPDILDALESLNDVGGPERPANVDAHGVVHDVAVDDAGIPYADALVPDFGDPETDDYEVEQPAA